MAEGSHLTIDETSLQSGTLNSTGVENALILKNMIESQNVQYDFTYYKMDMAADVQLLILSEGKSNIMPADVVLPLRPSSVGSAVGVDGVMLKAWRLYLATMKTLPHSIEPHIQKVGLIFMFSCKVVSNFCYFNYKIKVLVELIVIIWYVIGG